MEHWQDQAIVLAVRRHGENGGVVSLLTEGQGRQSGYVRGAQGKRLRGTLEPGNLVDAAWRARVSDNLGTLALELISSPAAHIMQDALKLAAMQSACALCDSALPEREGHAGLFHGLKTLFETLQGQAWGAAYILWEVAFLKELGFSLDFSSCAGGGDSDELAYISPKTGRAVSRKAGAPYKDKLLPLPSFLKPGGQVGDERDVLTGLKLTGYFLEHWAYAHHTRGIPKPRLRFYERFARFAGCEGAKNTESIKNYGTG